MRVLGLAILALVTILVQPAVALRAATIFVVNSAADTTDGACTPQPGGCTLREAIEAANANGNPGIKDFITFAIPGEGVHTIAVGSGNPRTADLPPLLEAVFIDGTTQPGSSCSPLQPMVELDGSHVSGDGFGLNFVGGPSRARGLSISLFGTDVIMQGFGSHHLECSQVGVDPTGETVRWKPPQYPLVRITSNGNFIGGLEPGAGNLLGGATGIVATTGMGTRIEGNTLGLAAPPPVPPAPDQRSRTAISLSGGQAALVSGNVLVGWQIGIDLEADESDYYSTVARNRIECTKGSPESLGIAVHGVGFRQIQTNRVIGCSTGILWHEGFGIVFENHLSNNKVGMSITGYSDCGIGVNVMEGNEIGLEVHHVAFATISATGNVIQADPSGLSDSGTGVFLHDISNTNQVSIGGLGANYGNTISGMALEGIRVENTAGVGIAGNVIGGTGATGALLPPEVGVRVVSGEASISENTISENRIAGVLVGQAAAVSVYANRIGSIWDELPPNGSGQRQSVGVLVEGGAARISQNQIVGHAGPGVRANGWREGSLAIGGNLFTGNRGPGAVLSGGVGAWPTENVFRANIGGAIIVQSGDAIDLDSNAFIDNVGLAVDLGGDGVTPNDESDADSGPNQLLNMPVLEHAVTSITAVSFSGSVNPSPWTTAVQLFATDQCDPSGYGEGEPIPGGFGYAGPDGSFVIQINPFTAGNLDGKSVTAIALQTVSGQSARRSSEMSACIQVSPTTELELVRMSPTAVVTDTPDFDLVVEANNALPGDQIFWNEIALDTTLENGRYLLAHVPNFLVMYPHSVVITVRRPGGATSNERSFFLTFYPQSDVDRSGNVDALDVLYLLTAIANDQYGVFDMDRDGRVTLADVLYIRKVVAGLIPE